MEPCWRPAAASAMEGWSSAEATRRRPSSPRPGPGRQRIGRGAPETTGSRRADPGHRWGPSERHMQPGSPHGDISGAHSSLMTWSLQVKKRKVGPVGRARGRGTRGHRLRQSGRDFPPALLCGCGEWPGHGDLRCCLGQQFTHSLHQPRPAWGRIARRNLHKTQICTFFFATKETIYLEYALPVQIRRL